MPAPDIRSHCSANPRCTGVHRQLITSPVDERPGLSWFAQSSFNVSALVVPHYRQPFATLITARKQTSPAETHVPLRTTGGNSQIFDLTTTTDVALREGQKVVVGKANLDSSDLALFLVLTARLVDLDTPLYPAGLDLLKWPRPSPFGKRFHLRYLFPP